MIHATSELGPKSSASPPAKLSYAAKYVAKIYCAHLFNMPALLGHRWTKYLHSSVVQWPLTVDDMRLSCVIR